MRKWRTRKFARPIRYCPSKPQLLPHITEWRSKDQEFREKPSNSRTRSGFAGYARKMDCDWLKRLSVSFLTYISQSEECTCKYSRYTCHVSPGLSEQWFPVSCLPTKIYPAAIYWKWTVKKDAEKTANKEVESFLKNQVIHRMKSLENRSCYKCHD